MSVRNCIAYAVTILVTPILAVICAAAWVVAIAGMSIVSLINLIADPEGIDL